MDKTEELLETSLDVLRSLQHMSDGRGRTYCATCKQPDCLPDCRHGAAVRGLAAALEHPARAAVRALEAAGEELESALQAAAAALTEKQERVARALRALHTDDDDDERGAVIE